jgi:hypothetical protein
MCKSSIVKKEKTYRGNYFYPNGDDDTGPPTTASDL